MEKQELISILQSISNCLEQWGREARSTFDQNALERRLGAAFHDAAQLVKLDNFLRAMTEPLPNEVSDIAPPTQRTGEEQPTKTQVDLEQPVGITPEKPCAPFWQCPFCDAPAVDEKKPVEGVPLCGTACSNFTWLKEHGATTCNTGCAALSVDPR